MSLIELFSKVNFNSNLDQENLCIEEPEEW